MPRAYLGVFRQSFREHEEDEEQVGCGEEQCQEGGAMVEHLLQTGSPGEVGPDQRTHREAH